MINKKEIEKELDEFYTLMIVDKIDDTWRLEIVKYVYENDKLIVSRDGKEFFKCQLTKYKIKNDIFQDNQQFDLWDIFNENCGRVWNFDIDTNKIKIWKIENSNDLVFTVPNEKETNIGNENDKGIEILKISKDLVENYIVKI